MTFRKRLTYYFFGLALGLVVVWAGLLKDRDRPSWLPQGRVFDFLSQVEIQIDDVAQCQLTCYGIPMTFMDAAFFKNADIDFEQSATQRKPCPEYYISFEYQGKKLVAFVEACEYCDQCIQEGQATLRNVRAIGQTSECNCD